MLAMPSASYNDERISASEPEHRPHAEKSSAEKIRGDAQKRRMENDIWKELSLDEMEDIEDSYRSDVESTEEKFKVEEGQNMDSTVKHEHYVKNKRQRSYDAMSTFRRSESAYERFSRKPYQTVRKVEQDVQD